LNKKKNTAPTETKSSSMLYTTGRLATGTRAVPEFTAKEITGDRRMPSRVEINAVPDANQMFYAGYRTNLPAFLYATINQTKVHCDVEGFDFELEPEYVMDFPAPMVYSQFSRKAFNADIFERFKTDFGMVVSADAGDVIKATFRYPTPELINILLESPEAINPKLSQQADRQAASISGYMAFKGVVDIISAFLMTVNPLALNFK
jgi:hypothetical protein